MVCCVFQAPNLVNNYGPRKSARTFVSSQEASNKLYTVLPVVVVYSITISCSNVMKSKAKSDKLFPFTVASQAL
jgi:hypothetical protein